MAKGNPSHIIKRERKKEKGSKSGKTGWVGARKLATWKERKHMWINQFHVVVGGRDIETLKKRDACNWTKHRNVVV
jgi:hypothetical protein